MISDDELEKFAEENHFLFSKVDAIDKKMEIINSRQMNAVARLTIALVKKFGIAAAEAQLDKLDKELDEEENG
jgi:hypothetical protein